MQKELEAKERFKKHCIENGLSYEFLTVQIETINYFGDKHAA